jgi:hypothetical protein
MKRPPETVAFLFVLKETVPDTFPHSQTAHDQNVLGLCAQ